MSENDVIPDETIAFMNLKGKIVQAMYEFSDKYAAPGSPIYPQCGKILVDALTTCLDEAQYQVAHYYPFTNKQTDHICYQIGEWYLMMKPLLEGQHNLGYMKEKLKTMICGE